LGAISKLWKNVLDRRVRETTAHHQRLAPGGWIRKVWVARLRPFSIATLVIYGGMSCEPWNYAMAQQAPGAVNANASGGALAELDRSIRGARDLAAELERQTAQGEQDLSPVLSALGSRLQEIEAADPEIQADFDEVGKRLKLTGVPHEILKRHQDAVSDYRANLSQLHGDIEANQRLYEGFRQDKSHGHAADAESKYKELKNKAANLSANLREKIKDPPHTRIDPNRLPHRGSDLPRREPRLSAADFSTLSTSSQVQGTEETQARVLSLGAMASLPGPSDLGETPDVRLTPEIRTLAAQLGNDPIRIYQYVRGEIGFVPTYGSIQGAGACLSTRLCNDLDTASLLIALLRAAGVPARYAIGTIQVPTAKVQNWMGGFTDPKAAVNFIGSNGTPVAGLTSGGTLIAARMEHVWVEAFVDYVPSRGAVRGSGDTWVPLDASFKQFSYTSGVDTAAATAGFDNIEFFRQLATRATVNETNGSVTGIDTAALGQKLLELREQIASYGESQGGFSRLDDLAGGKVTLPQQLSVLPGSLPYQVLVRGLGFSQVPDALRHRLHLEVTSASGSTPDLTYTISLPELAGRKITLSYSPATAVDEATIKASLPSVNDPTPSGAPITLPAYLIHVKPELRIEGALVATGASSTLGTSGQLSLLFDSPDNSQRRVDNDLTAGTYNALVLDLGRNGDPAGLKASIQARLERLRTGDVSGITREEVAGDFLYSAGLLYWSEVELFDRMASEAQGVVACRHPSEGIFSYGFRVSFLFGVPRLVSGGAFLTDVDTDVQAVIARDGDAKKPVDYMAVTGAVKSRAESAIYDQIINGGQPTGQGITAASYLEAAARQGIPIFHITRDNLVQALSLLQVSSAVRSDIEDAVNAGKVVTIPQREFAKDGFFGIGYIVFDLQTGAGGYLISGGLAGGGSEEPSSGPFAEFMMDCFMTVVGLRIHVVDKISAVNNGVGLVAELYKAQSNPNLTPDQAEAIGGLFAAITLVKVLLVAAGPVLGPSAALILAVYSIYFSFISVVASGVLDFYLGYFERQTTPELSQDRYRRRDDILVRSLPYGAGAAK
jgi:transglutaminase-like putative cysteine protease